MSALSAREGYRLWAPHYEAETAVSHLEQQVVAGLGIEVAGRTLLDAGCGTVRRMRETDAALAIGIDLSPEMLAQAGAAPLVAAANVCALPFAAEVFDVIWCRLMIGHVCEIDVAFSELSRVCRVGGATVVTDVCAEAVQAGHRRTFRDPDGAPHELEHFLHSNERLAAAAHVAGFRVEQRRTGVVGEAIRPFYADAGRLEAYEEQRGLPLVRAFVLRKPAR